MRLFTATGEREMISFSNSHFLLGSLSSYYATNLTPCRSRTSAVRRTPPPPQARKRDVQDVCLPGGCAVGGSAFSCPGPTLCTRLSEAALGETKEPNGPRGILG